MTVIAINVACIIILTITITLITIINTIIIVIYSNCVGVRGPSHDGPLCRDASLDLTFADIEVDLAMTYPPQSSADYNGRAREAPQKSETVALALKPWRPTKQVEQNYSSACCGIAVVRFVRSYASFSPFLYGILTTPQLDRLDAYYCRFLRRIVGIKASYYSKVTNRHAIRLRMAIPIQIYAKSFCGPQIRSLPFGSIRLSLLV